MDYFSYFNNPKSDYEENRRRLFFIIPAHVGVFVCITVGLVNLWNGNAGLGSLDFAMAAVIAIGLLLLKRMPSGRIVYRVVIFCTSVLFTYFIHLGGRHGSLLFWIFLLPPLTHFILGKKEGLWFSLGVYCLAAAIIIPPAEFTGAFPYPLAIKTRFLIVFLFSLVTANRYEAIREEIQNGLNQEREKLKEANDTLQYLKTAIDHSVDGIAVAGSDKRIKFANPAWASMHGLTQKEVEGAHARIFHSAAQYENEVAPFLKRVASKGSNYGEMGHVRKDGTEFPCWMSISLIRGEGEDPTGVVAVAKDISERKAAEAALIASEERNRALLEATPDAVTVYDKDAKVLYVNPAFEQLFGWTAEEVLGKPLDFVPSEERPKTDELIARMRKGESVLEEIKRYTKDGRLLYIRASASMFWDKDRHFLGTVVISRDITDRKKAEEALRKAKKDAETANIAKSQFVANMSHEIRTPMNGVIGMTGLLLDTDLDERQREFAETIQSSAANLLTVINDILDFSKIEADKLELESIGFDLRFTLEDVSDLLAIKAQAKNLEFVCMVDPDVPSLLVGDPGRLRQLIINICNNAIKFTREGEVVVRVVGEEIKEDKAYLRFTITDTGIGIPEDKQNDLFAPFTQMDASTTREYGGTGLGLSICKRLVQLMNGEIGVSSRPGEGATFWFSLPFQRQRQSREPLATASIQGRKILIVDDNATNRRLLSVLLETWGCRHEEAPDAQNALLKIKKAALEEKEPYSLIITDMQMPLMDGEELGRLIKNDPDLASSSLLMMTSIANRGDAARLSEIGFSAYLTKPIKQSVLFDCLQTVLGADTIPRPKEPKPIITRHAIAEAKKRRYRLLLVEDNLVNRKVALSILDNLGFRTDAVSNGLEAISALENQPYDLVLMDCQMPELDGYEATKRIRSAESRVLNQGIPIIAMTAHAMAGDREKCIACGMDDYISKPVEPAALNQLVEKWLDSSNPPSKPAPTPAEEAPVKAGTDVFDLEGLFSRLLEDGALVKEVLDAFLKELPNQIRTLHIALEERNLTLAGLKAHTLAGSSASVGACAIQAAAKDLETAIMDSDLNKSLILCEQLEKEGRLFHEAVREAGMLG
ncbi:PAS domain S-box protein [Desulfatibacillum aliphaticivorans]|uniref:PAS domain S-box protein n=1 Tax=Desulfatibacillum aliphaticivorans TaxID=218208 RepID=UPI0003FA8EB0|nr:PAS domain S-box protein [Desulfatibacillum aliphaticivorans]